MSAEPTKAPNLIAEAMKVYRKEGLPNPDIYEDGLTDGLRLAIASLQVFLGMPNELEIEVEDERNS